MADGADRSGTASRNALQAVRPGAVPEAVPQPETVFVSSPAGSVGPGPADERMYVIDPIGKRLAYGLARRPFAAIRLSPAALARPVFPPAEPDADGHFDHISPDSPEFEAAHLFGAVRFTLDVWEKYFGHRSNGISRPTSTGSNWCCSAISGKMPSWATASWRSASTSPRRRHRAVQPELRHRGARSRPLHRLCDGRRARPVARQDAEYYGFHESAADLTALIAALHFDSVVDELLATTHGNLYTLNLVNRIAELSTTSRSGWRPIRSRCSISSRAGATSTSWRSR